MSLKVYTSNPESLYKKMNDVASVGNLPTWTVDADGDFTHNTTQWRGKAWFRKREIRDNEMIIFGLVGRRNINVTKSEYAVFHGRFAEMLLSNFDDLISKIEISSLLTKFDIVHKASE